MRRVVYTAFISDDCILSENCRGAVLYFLARGESGAGCQKRRRVSEKNP